MPSSALISERGFVEVTLRDVAAAADLGLADLYRLYPDKVALAAAFMARIDAAVLAGTPRQADPEETARDRLFDVMMRRYDALQALPRGLRCDPPGGHARSPAGAGAWGRRCGDRWRPCWRRPPCRATGSRVQCGKMACWRSTMRWHGSSTATTRSISRRPWRRSTAASRWPKNGLNSLRNIRVSETERQSADSRPCVKILCAAQNRLLTWGRSNIN